jgi:hypothetical protein
MLVFDDRQRLLAVLTRLSAQHGSMAGQWFMEAGFGQLGGARNPVFASLDEAQSWIGERLGLPRSKS